MALAMFTLKHRDQTQTLQRSNLVSLKALRILRSAHLNAGSHDVDQMAGLIGHGARPLDLPGPVRNQRGRNASLVLPMLVKTKGSVAGIRPRHSIALIGVLRPG